MDKLAYGFVPHVKEFIRYEREVTSVRNAEKDTVVIRHRAAGNPSAYPTCIREPSRSGRVPTILQTRRGGYGTLQR